MKIKIFGGFDAHAVEKSVNDFVKCKNVISVKFSSAITDEDVYTSVMVLYEELKEEK